MDEMRSGLLTFSKYAWPVEEDTAPPPPPPPRPRPPPPPTQERAETARGDGKRATWAADDQVEEIELEDDE